MIFRFDSLFRPGRHGKVFVLSVSSHDALIQPQLQTVMLSRPPVVLQRFTTSWLLSRAHQGQIPDFEQLWCREKNHVYGIAVDRIAEAGFVDDQRPHSSALGLDGRRQARGPCSDANHIVSFHKNFSLTGVFWNCKSRRFYCWGGRSRICVSSRRNRASSSSLSGVASTSF